MTQPGASPAGGGGGGGAHGTAAAIAAARRKPTLVQIGSALGIASNLLGWAIFLMLCMGFEQAKIGFSLLPLALGVVGFVLTCVGGVTQKHADVDTHVLASIFVNLFGIVGGLLEMAYWLGWTVLPK
jgi:hypothetical protein